ncbi:MAG: helix-turn-helix transcriptional regulator [Lachnospiraceae bacterium]
MGGFKELRKRRGLTQEMIADELGLAQQTISRIESNPHTMQMDILIQAADYFNVSADYILGRTEQKYNEYSLARVAHYMEKYDDVVIKYDKLTEKNKIVVQKLIEALEETE